MYCCSCRELFLFHPLFFFFLFSERRTLLHRAQEATYAAEDKFLHISASNMLTNVYTSPEGFGVGRQLL